MRTELNDLKDQLKDVERNIDYSKSIGMPKDSNIFRYLIDRRFRLIDTINNIR
jgi:hypothetical protein